MSAPTASLAVTAAGIIARFAGGAMERPRGAAFLAFHDGAGGGCAVIPYRHDYEGSTLFLPRPVNRLFAVKWFEGGAQQWARTWTPAGWSDPQENPPGLLARADSRGLQLLLDIGSAGLAEWVAQFTRGAAFVMPIAWLKDLAQNWGWGALIPLGEESGSAFIGDCALPEPGLVPVPEEAARFEFTHRKPAPSRARIYQLFPRLFSNVNEQRKPNGTAAENGVGKFADITAAALRSLREELNVTCVWLTGVLAHATGTAFPAIGKAADDPDLLKGIAGSPYAVRDYGDVAADLAIDPARRLEEFKALCYRARAAGLRVLIDFVPNHVARNHSSALLEFGRLDDRKRFFHPSNNFFWLQPDSPGGGPPLRLPTMKDGQAASATCQVLGGCDGLFEAERDSGRVTGNNAATWSPSIWDWYETAKLNYGYDFTSGTRAYPNASAPDEPIPDTWRKMDEVLRHWQALGVDGFRCDMAHMVPPEFWQWALAQARARDPEAFFIAEAYNDDPMKVEGGDPFLRGFGSVAIELLNAGFDAVYDAPALKSLHRIYDGDAWANDLDAAVGVHEGRIALDYAFHRGVRYAENHDEVRLAARGQWASTGMAVGRPVSAILFALSRGPILLYNGQEVGEPADGAEGFGGDDAKTTIFDYWSMPELCKWVNGHRYDGGNLSAEQRDLRSFYGRLLALMDELPFRDGDFIPLNAVNLWNPCFGRLDGETASGHWLYAFLRHDPPSGEAFLVVSNLHPSATLSNLRIDLPSGTKLVTVSPDDPEARDELCGVEGSIVEDGRAFQIPALPPLTPAFFRRKLAPREPS